MTATPMTRERGPTPPGRIVALGGGTGLPSVLRGLKTLVAAGDQGALAAVVTMTDDGGSSGRLRRGLGLLPPGDVRNCLVSLASEEDLLSDLFQHRFEGCDELGGHNLGNLILAALATHTGSFHRAIDVSSRVLRTRGRILPATLQDVTLRAELEDGRVIHGESNIGRCSTRIKRVTLDPADVRPARQVIASILRADLIVLGPGSLYTSVIPNLLVQGVAEALRMTQGTVVLVGNLVSEPGEAVELTGEEHVRALEEHAAGPFIDAVLAHDGPFDAARLERYLKEGARPLVWPEHGTIRGIPLYREPIVGAGAKLRHDPRATAEALVRVWSRMHERKRSEVKG